MDDKLGEEIMKPSMCYIALTIKKTWNKSIRCLLTSFGALSAILDIFQGQICATKED